MANRINVFGNDNDLNSIYLIDITDHMSHFGVANQIEFESLLGYGGYGYDSSSPELYPYKTQGYNTDAFMMQWLTNISWMIGKLPIGTTIGDRLDTLDDKLSANISSNELMKIMTALTGTGVFNNQVNGIPIQISQTSTGVNFIISSITACAVGADDVYQIRELGNIQVNIDVNQYSTLENGTVLEFDYYAIMNAANGNSLQWAASIAPEQIVDLQDPSRTEIDYSELPYGLMPTEYQSYTSGQEFEYYAGGLLVNGLTEEQVLATDLLIRYGSLVKLYTFRLSIVQGTTTLTSFEAIKHFDVLPSMTQLLTFQKESLSGTASQVVVSKDDVTIDYEGTYIPYTMPAGSMVGPFAVTSEPVARHIKCDYRLLSSLVGTEYITLKNRLSGNRLPETRTFNSPGLNEATPTDRFMDGKRIWIGKTTFEFGRLTYMDVKQLTIFGPDDSTRLVNLNSDTLLNIYGDVNCNGISSPIAFNNMASQVTMSTVDPTASRSHYLALDYTPVTQNDINYFPVREGWVNGSRMPYIPELKYRLKDSIAPGVEIRINGSDIEFYNASYNNDMLDGRTMEGTVWVEFVPLDELEYLIKDEHVSSVKWILIQDMVFDNDIMTATADDIDGTYAEGDISYIKDNISELWSDSDKQNTSIIELDAKVTNISDNVDKNAVYADFKIDALTDTVNTNNDILTADISTVSNTLDSNVTSLNKDITDMSTEINIKISNNENSITGIIHSISDLEESTNEQIDSLDSKVEEVINDVSDIKIYAEENIDILTAGLETVNGELETTIPESLSIMSSLVWTTYSQVLNRLSVKLHTGILMDAEETLNIRFPDEYATSSITKWEDLFIEITDVIYTEPTEDSDDTEIGEDGSESNSSVTDPLLYVDYVQYEILEVTEDDITYLEVKVTNTQVVQLIINIWGTPTQLTYGGNGISVNGSSVSVDIDNSLRFTSTGKLATNFTSSDPLEITDNKISLNLDESLSITEDGKLATNFTSLSMSDVYPVGATYVQYTGGISPVELFPMLTWKETYNHVSNESSDPDTTIIIWTLWTRI